MKGLFITGTNTGVGKTVVGIGLGLCLKEFGSLGVMKPVETGVLANKPRDGMRYQEVLELSEDLSDICPIQLEHPLAPLPASELEKKEISLELITEKFTKMKKEKDFILVEGAGGLLVPILKEFMMIDLAMVLDLEVILVVGNELGCINHTLLSYHYLKSLRIKVLGIILNCFRKHSKDKELLEQTNKKTLKDLIQDTRFFEISHIACLEDQKTYHKIFRPIVREILEKGCLFYK